MAGARVELRKQTPSVQETREDLRMQLAATQRAEATEADHKALRQMIEQQGDQIALLRKQIQVISSRDNDLKKALRAATAERDEFQNLLLKANRHREELYLRIEEVYAALYALNARIAVIERNGSNPSAGHEVEAHDKTRYDELVLRVREVVRACIPHDSTVLVAARGDDGLLALYGRRAWHFPQAKNGVYAGFHPRNSISAIVHLETLRAKGANYLVLPQTMFWWLDHYVEFRCYLDTYYRLIVRQDDSCVIFDLRGAGASMSRSWQSVLAEAIALCQNQLGHKPSILDWNSGLDLANKFPELTIFSPADTDCVLPFIDESVDLVAAGSWDFISRKEARRVATAAVMNFSQSRNGSDQGPAVEIEWKLGVTSAAETLTSSIVIPCCNNLVETEACLNAVRDTLPGHFKGEIILVDAAPTDNLEQLQRLTTSDRRVKLARSRKVKGFLAACNQGAKAATGDILIFVNSAVLPLAGWLPPFLQILRDYPASGAVGGKHIYSDGRLQEAGGIVFSNGSIAGFGNSDPAADMPLYNFVRKVDYCSVGFLATRRTLFEELKGFDAHFGSLDYGAADYGLRISDKGWLVYYQPESAAANVGDESGATNSSPHDEDSHGKNREMLIKRWATALKQRPALPPRFGLAAWRDLATECS